LIINYIKRLQLIYAACGFKSAWLFYFSLIVALILSISEASFIGLVYTVVSNFFDSSDKLSSSFFLLSNYFDDKIKFQNFLLLTLICIAFLVAMLKIINLKINAYLFYKINTLVSSYIFSNTLCLNLNFHQKQNSSSLISTIITKSSSVGEITFFLLGIIRSIAMLISITVMAVFLSSKIFLLYFFLILVIFFLAHKLIKSKMKKLGVVVANENIKIVQSLQESYANIVLIIVHNVEKFFYNNFKKAVFNLRKSQGDIVFFSSLPYILINFFFIASVLILIYFFKESSPSLVAIVVVLLLAIQKLFPSFNEIFSNLSTIRSLSQNFKDTEILLFKTSNEKREVILEENVEFNNQIEFKNVYFKYESSKDFVLENINLSINKNSVVGILGKTGAGKSSLINLLVGFFLPSSGVILSDSHSINIKNIFCWQKKISIVPQSVMLLDDTIEKNIIFNNLKDEEKLNSCIKAACLEKMVDEFNQRSDNLIGENGKRISGGQKQRIGIARAIYRDTDILILDESFNNLDLKTKISVLNNIKNLKKTIIIISHDKSDLINCDTLLLIENKSISRINSI
jgi:ABC-type multidrug transport system fused ATPase/permease subunit